MTNEQRAAVQAVAAELRRRYPRWGFKWATGLPQADDPRLAVQSDWVLAATLTLILEDAGTAIHPEESEAPAPDEAVDAFLAEVRGELIRARAKFPGDRIMTIALAEEFGELAKAILDEPAANVRKEAVQTAVMAARVVLDGDGSVAEWRAARGLDPLVTP